MMQVLSQGSLGGYLQGGEHMAERYGGTLRKNLEDSDFVFPDTRTFPVMTRGDVEDAVSSWGRYKGNETFETFKRRLTQLAKRKNLESALPNSWMEAKGGIMDISRLDDLISVIDQVARKAKATKPKRRTLPNVEEDITEMFGDEVKARRMKKKMEDDDDDETTDDDEDFMAMLEEVGRKARRMKKKMEDDGDDEYLNGFLGESELDALIRATATSKKAKRKPKKPSKEDIATGNYPGYERFGWSDDDLGPDLSSTKAKPKSPKNTENNTDDDLADLKPIPPDPEIEKMMKEIFGSDIMSKVRPTQGKKTLKIRGANNATKAHDLATIVTMVEEAVQEALEELNVLYEKEDYQEMVDEEESIQMIMEALGRKGYEYDEDGEIAYDIYVYTDFAVVEFPRASYRVPYRIEKGDVAIGMPSEWIRVTETWKDVPDAPTFSEAVARNQMDAVKSTARMPWSDETLEYTWDEDADEDVVAEMKSIGESIKMLDDGTVIAQAIRFGSPAETDISEFRDYFTKSTNFWLTEWQTRPMLYDHATDSQTRDDPVVGQWVKAWTDEAGVWLKGQLNKAHKYAEAIKELAKMGLLKLSTDSAPHLVIRARNSNGTHEIKRWPIVAASLTVQPAEPRLPAVEVKTTTSKKPNHTPTSIDTPLLLKLVDDIQKLGETE